MRRLLFGDAAELFPAKSSCEKPTRRMFARSGTISEESSGFNVHGRMYTLRSRAFSSGEMLDLGIILVDGAECQLKYGDAYFISYCEKLQRFVDVVLAQVGLDRRVGGW